jgi:hypothetical protein
MSFKSFAIIYAGIAFNVWTIWALVTPIFPTTYHQYGPGASRDSGLLAPPARVYRMPAVGLDSALRTCFVFEGDWITEAWAPSVSEAMAADSAVSDYLGELSRHTGIPELDTLLDGMRNDARQVIGVHRLTHGRSYLINGYEPGAEGYDGFLTRCLDKRWRWSIEYTPESGVHHFSAFRDTCEDPNVIPTR